MSKLLSLRSTLSSSSSNCSSSSNSSSSSDDYNKNTTSLCHDITFVNSTYVSSAVFRVDQLAAAVDALDARRSATDAAVSHAAAESQLAVIRSRLATVTAAVDSGTEDIAQLQDEVRRLRDDVRDRAWDSVAEQVRSSVDEHQTWIESLKVRRDHLRAQITRMSTLLAMFTRRPARSTALTELYIGLRTIPLY